MLACFSVRHPCNCLSRVKHCDLHLHLLALRVKHPRSELLENNLPGEKCAVTAMSTFDGIVAEFPDIRIDRFRHDPHRPALAHFLSHVHSDHLVGLESRNAVPLYCSPATRELLLRLEKYPNRMNFAKGILESRKQTYKRQYY